MTISIRTQPVQKAGRCQKKDSWVKLTMVGELFHRPSEFMAVISRR